MSAIAAFVDTKGFVHLNRIAIERIKGFAALYISCVRGDEDALVYSEGIQ